MIAQDKIADLVTMADNPLTNLAVTGPVDFAMKAACL